jgi:hypothetical protein
MIELINSKKTAAAGRFPQQKKKKNGSKYSR